MSDITDDPDSAGRPAETGEVKAGEPTSARPSSGASVAAPGSGSSIDDEAARRGFRNDAPTGDVPRAGKGAGRKRERKPRKKRPFPLNIVVGLFRVVLAIALVLCLAAAVLLGAWLLDIRKTVEHLPSSFVAYAQIASATELFDSVIGLKAVDEFMTEPAFARAHEILVELRSSDLLKQEWARALMDVRMDFMLVTQNDYVAAVDFGPRSALTRLAPLVGASGLLKVDGLSFGKNEAGEYFAYSSGGQSFYLAIESNLCLLSNDLATLDRCRKARESGDNLANRFARSGLDPDSGDRGTIRFVADARSIASMALSGADMLAPIAAKLVFEGEALVDVFATNEKISLRARVPVRSSDPDVAKIVGRASSVPSALEALPEATEYFSMINLAELETLWKVTTGVGGKGVTDIYSQANEACKLALGIDLGRLLFSWTGSEAGVFGLEKSGDPVFFVRVADESARKEVFSKAFNNFLLGSSSSTVVDDVRLSRIDFPFYVDMALGMFDVQVPEPYFAAEGGFVFFSVSAENVARTVNAVRTRRSLSAQRAFREMTARSSDDMAAGLYYTLGRTMPFFLRGSAPAVRALRLYGRGLAAIRFRSGFLEISLDAIAVAGTGADPLSGFPFRAEGRMSGAFEAFKFSGRGGATLAYSLDGPRLVVRSPQGADKLEISLDSPAFLVPEREGRGTVARLWYATTKGTIGLIGADGKEVDGFPLRLGASLDVSPVALGDGRLLVALEGGARFVSVARSGKVTEEAFSLEDRLSSPPAWKPGLGLAVYARSFMGRLWLLDGSLAPVPGWPVDVDGISSGSPFFLKHGNAWRIMLLCEDGTLHAWNPDGTPCPGFPAVLPSPMRATPAVSSDGRFAFAVSEAGKLVVFDATGTPLRTGETPAAAGSAPAIGDATGDGREELFAFGAANSVWGFTIDLVPLEGFPLKGGFTPSFVDLDADGKPELVTAGYDDNVHAYVVR